MSDNEDKDWVEKTTSSQESGKEYARLSVIESVESFVLAALSGLGGLVVFGCLLVLPLASLGLSIFEYLKSGYWHLAVLMDYVSIPNSTGWVGFDRLVIWAMTNLWVGFISIAVGVFLMLVWSWVLIASDQY